MEDLLGPLELLWELKIKQEHKLSYQKKCLFARGNMLFELLHCYCCYRKRDIHSNPQTNTKTSFFTFYHRKENVFVFVSVIFHSFYESKVNGSFM